MFKPKNEKKNWERNETNEKNSRKRRKILQINAANRKKNGKIFKKRFFN